MSDDEIHYLDDMNDFDWIAKIRDSAWTPSACLTAERIMALKGDRPPVSSVLALLAFNGENFRISDNDSGITRLEAGAEILRVGKHLFEAARRGDVKMWGCKDIGDELTQIPAIVFEQPYEPAAADETAIEISLSQISFAHAKERIETKKRGRWLSVLVDKASLAAWLTREIFEAKKRLAPLSNADARHAILERFRAGNITKEQADAESRNAGFNSMEERPSADECDPMKLPRWTLPQTLAWIIYRTPEAVRERHEVWRAESVIWHEVFGIVDGERQHVRWEFRAPDRQSPMDVINEAIRIDTPEIVVLNPINARDELSDNLKRGALTAYGVRDGDREPRAIDKTAWDAIDTLFVFNSLTGPYDAGRDGDQKALYSNVLVFPENVLTIWPMRTALGLAPPNLFRALQEAIAKQGGAPLKQDEAAKIASGIGAIENQKEVRMVLKSIQGKVKRGPRGPRKAAK
jgi:hypothetical protein